MRRRKIHVGLEIGTSKTCMVVGEVKADGTVKILGIGVTKSAGVREGEIYDFSQARACLKDTLAKARNASDVEIGSVYLAVTGSHIRGLNHRSTYPLPDGDVIVTSEHVEQVRRLGFEASIPRDYVYLHPVLNNYRVDSLKHLTAPVGLFGKVVEADFHIVHCIGTRIQNSIKLVREMPLEVDDIVFSPIAIAQMLEREQRERGALVIDIGGGTTDYALYLDGAIAASGCIPIGGNHVTNDIRLATGLPFSQADHLKIMEGDASADPTKSPGTAKLTDDRRVAEVEFSRDILNKIIRQRLEETLKRVRARLPAGAVEGIGAGAFITGGTSLMRGLGKLAFDVFGCNIYCPETSNELTCSNNPLHATAIGLIRYALNDGQGWI